MLPRGPRHHPARLPDLRCSPLRPENRPARTHAATGAGAGAHRPDHKLAPTRPLRPHNPLSSALEIHDRRRPLTGRQASRRFLSLNRSELTRTRTRPLPIPRGIVANRVQQRSVEGTKFPIGSRLPAFLAGPGATQRSYLVFEFPVGNRAVFLAVLSFSRTVAVSLQVSLKCVLACENRLSFRTRCKKPATGLAI